MASVHADRSTLRQLLAQYFDEDELHSLAFDLSIDYESLKGANKAGKARELVEYLDRHSRLDELAEIGPKLRPDVPWNHAFGETEEDGATSQTIPSKQPHKSTQAHPADRETVDLRESQGAVYKPSGPVEQHFGHHVVIEGSISGQVAVGNGNIQTQTIGSPSAPSASNADQSVLNAILAELKNTVADGAPADKRDAALERLDEFGEALTAQAPDLATMEYVQGWFARQAPPLGEAITAILAHPVIVQWIESSGEDIAAEFRRRFGS